MTTSNEASQKPAGTSAAANTPAGRASSRTIRALSGFGYRWSLLIVLVLLVVVFSILLPTTFPTLGNLRTVTSTQAVLMTVTLGLTFPLAAGEFDMSFGGVLGLSSTVTAVLTTWNGWPLWAAVIVVLAAGLLIGLINATIIIRLHVNSLVTTLGMSTLLWGITLWACNNQVVSGGTGLLADICTAVLFDLPYPVFFALGIATVAWYIQEYTPFGRHVYFVGSGRETARLSGIDSTRVLVACFMISAFVASIAGMMNYGRLGSADPNIGSFYMLPGFATVFLGATAVKPGRYNAWGTVLAVWVLVVGIVGLEFLGGAGYLEQMFNGSALIIAVAFSMAIRRSASAE